MAAFPTFRNRRIPSRSNYTLLENTDSDIDSVRRRSISSQIEKQSIAPVLCDKCWLRHERNRASKRCLDCKQNLCTVCARGDEITRPWWLPNWMVQCWRFLFTKAYIPHSIVDLDEQENERPHWAHTQEASHVHPIPRVTRSSLRSNKSGSSVETNKSKPSKTRHASLTKDRGRERSPRSESRNHRLAHSQSFDGKARKRQSNERKPRRTRSSEELVYKHRRDDLDRLKRYNDNWEKSFMIAEEDEEKMRQRKCRNKMKGKDIDIEITDDKEIKLTVNSSEEGSKNKSDRSSIKCAIPKSKSKKKSKDNSPKPYTEQIFEEVPIWFKKSPKHPSNERPKRNNSSQERRRPLHEQTREKLSMEETLGTGESLNNHMRHEINSDKQRNAWPPRDSSQKFDSKMDFNESDNNNSNSYAFNRDRRFNTDATPTGKQNTAYIVEEPPDSCPICLEDLPGAEARALACCHAIHTKCLITYLYKMDLDFGIRCPLCAQTTIIRNYYVPKERWYMELPVSTAV
ncbi:uncharacterized protein LOC123550147 [Mercenaria mercenaria]|uniref:uncharacterized protein LOC123550147 n=1 Tax=Mercenaria mercenaria TaxID=6596 RepID=UPI00234E892A|nr:uncharacterized protein LOC123550147 [Mercenaria mercenaria]